MAEIVKHGITFLLFVTFSIAVVGKFKKLGSHKPPSKGATVLAGQFPVPGVFYYHFIKVGQPLLMKNVLNETGYTAFVKWTDTYLRTKYGDERVEIERGKKEDRNGKALELKLSKFLDIYKDSDLYMVHTVPDSMKDEVLVPNSLHCGGFQDNIQEAVLWFSSGETKSVLHYDSVDNINCLLDGEKKLVLIDKRFKRMVEEHGWVEDGAYSEVDVDSVDPGMFPGVYNADWYQINMQKGDCVYIPYKWYHHVYSPQGRNLAVNLWFSHLWWFNQTDCDEHSSTENKPLSQFTMASPNTQLRSDFLSNFAESKGVSQKYFIMKSSCKKEEDAIKLWEMLNTNKDRQLTWEEFYSFDVDEAVQKVPQCFNIELEDEGGEKVGEDEAEKIDSLSQSRKGDNEDEPGKGDNDDETERENKPKDVEVADNTLETNGNLDEVNVGNDEDNIKDSNQIHSISLGEEIQTSESSEEILSTYAGDDLDNVENKYDDSQDLIQNLQQNKKLEHDEF